MKTFKFSRFAPELLLSVSVLLLAIGLPSSAHAERGVAITHQFHHTKPSTKALTVDSDGSLYGFDFGSAYGAFRITPAGVVSQPVGGEGLEFVSGFTKAPDGNLYGVTAVGSIHRWTPGAGLTKIADVGSEWFLPGGLAVDSAGHLYVDVQARANGASAVLRFTPAGVLTVLTSFDDPALLLDTVENLTILPDGFLYATAYNQTTGGIALIRMSLPSGAATVVIADIGYTYQLLSAPGRGLHGLRSGDVTRLSPDDGVSVLTTFDGSIDQIAANAAGLVFGIGPDQIVFMDPSGPATTVFANDDQDPALNALAISGDGLISFGERAAELGVEGTRVRQLQPDGIATPTPFATLPYDSDGNFPLSPLATGLDGNFYGIAQIGSSAGRGVFFQVRPDGAYTNVRDLGEAGDPLEVTCAPVTGADGAFYFAGYDEEYDSRIYRITATGTLSQLPITTSVLNWAAVFVNGGSLHGLSDFGSRGIHRIPMSGATTLVAAIADDGREIVPRVAVSPDGDMSFYLRGQFATPNELVRVTSTGATESVYPFEGFLLNPGPSAGADGSLNGVSYDSNLDETSFFTASPSGTVTEYPLAACRG